LHSVNQIRQIGAGAYFGDMRRLHAALGLCLLAFRVTAQLTPVTEEIQQDVIEGLFEDYETGDGGDIQPEWLLLLEDLRHRPLNINQADADDLRVFFFLDGNQIQAILAHRATYGEYLHPLELQVVEGLDIRTVQRLLPGPEITGSTGLIIGRPDAASSRCDGKGAWKSARAISLPRMARRPPMKGIPTDWSVA
jgi:hypothetical protein